MGSENFWGLHRSSPIFSFLKIKNPRARQQGRNPRICAGNLRTRDPSPFTRLSPIIIFPVLFSLLIDELLRRNARLRLITMLIYWPPNGRSCERAAAGTAKDAEAFAFATLQRCHFLRYMEIVHGAGWRKAVIFQHDLVAVRPCRTHDPGTRDPGIDSDLPIYERGRPASWTMLRVNKAICEAPPNRLT